MGIPVVTSSSPSNLQSGVYKNKVLSVTFSESLLSSTVNGNTFVLRNLDADERVPVDITLSSNVVYVRPVRHLLPNTTYKLTIVGSSTAIGDPIKSSSTSEALVTTVYVTFTTSNEIETTNLQKTDTQIALEGEILLPSNVIVRAQTSYLEILGSEPQNKAFGVDPLIAQVIISFGVRLFDDTLDYQTLSTSDLTDQVVVSIAPYYEEDEDYLAFPTTSDGRCNFKWQQPTSEFRAFDFTDVSGTLSVSGPNLIWTPDRELPSNAKITFTIDDEFSTVSGAKLDSDYKVEFFVKTAPEVVSIDRIRDEFYPFVLSNWTDDMIGKTIYKNLLDALTFTRWNVCCNKKNEYLRQYVLYSTIVDIFNGLKIEEDLQAGHFKRLGDLTIRFDVKITDAIPAKQKEAMKKMEELKDKLTSIYRSAPVAFVQGFYHPTQRKYQRTRLWKQDMLYSLEGYAPGVQDAGNTRDVRATKLPGQLDPW